MQPDEIAPPTPSLPDAPPSQSATHLSHSYRVLMIAPTSFFADYGCHVRILEEARALQKLGHQITIATYHNGRTLPGLDIRRTLPIPWRHQYEVGSSRHKIAFDLLLGLKTLGILLRNKYDIIHAHLHEGASIGLVLGRLFRIPVVFDFQGSLTEEMIDHNFLRRQSLIYGPLRSLETWIDRSSSAILTSSVHAEQILVDHFQCNPAQIHILPDCVNADVWRPTREFDTGELAALRNQLGIPPDTKLIVYLGLLAEYQGTGLLLEAFQRILAQHSNVSLLLMGFPGVNLYESQARHLGIRHAVTFTGRVPYENAPKYLALGDIAAAPKLSITESSGKLLNYMATALPTVAFDTPVAREYLGRDGLFAVRGDVESLASKLAAGLFPPEENPTLHVDAGIRLRQRAKDHFEWQQAAQSIVDTYNQLTGRHQQGSVAQPLATTRR